MSLRLASTMARNTLRPMRPNPLMATRTDMTALRSLASSQFSQCRFRDLLGGDPELLVKVLVGRAGTKRRHADKDGVGADDFIPALAHRGFDADAHRRGADHFLPLGGRERTEQLERGHRD